MNYSWITLQSEKPAVLRFPAYRARYDAEIQGGGWFAFLPKDVDQDDESKAGTWLGPLYYETTAILIAYEQNEWSRRCLASWKAQVTEQLSQRQNLISVNAVGK